jgi:uncharacterized protein (DUF1697 family)
MARFVALLRGVNVGKGRRVPMVELRALLAKLGYRDVRTLLNSGNAIFEGPSRSAAAHAVRIRAAIAESMSIDVSVIVKSAREFAAILAENELAAEADDPARLLVAFTDGAQNLQDLSALASLTAPPERFLLGRHAAYLWCPDGILESRAAEALLGKTGRAATSRNWATVGRIAALLDCR